MLAQLTNRIRRSYWVGVLLLCASLSSILPLRAAEYSIDSTYTLQGRFSDNYRLVENPSSDTDELTGADFLSRWAFARAADRSTLGLNIETDSGAYNLDEFNTFDYRGTARYSRQSERNQWNVYAGYNKDSTRISEESETGSGLFEVSDKRVESISGGGGWFGQLTERNSINVSVSAISQDYDTNRLSDYDYTSGNALWQYVVGPRLRLQTRAGYSLYESDDSFVVRNPNRNDPTALGFGNQNIIVQLFALNEIESSCASKALNDTHVFILNLAAVFDCTKTLTQDIEQQTYSLQLGFVYLFTERLSLDALVGQSQTDTQVTRSYSNNNSQATDTVAGEVRDSDSDNLTFDVSLDYDADTLQYRLNATTRESANSVGTVTLNTTASFDVSWDFSERSRYLAELKWIDQESIDDNDDAFLDRERIRLRLNYRYRLSEYWSVSAEYRRNEREQAVNDFTARSDEAFLTLTWQPSRVQWSR